MTDVLPSYVAGCWHTGQGDGETVRDAVTGEPVARVTSAGVDLAVAVSFARETGGSALRALSFAERAALVKDAAVALSQRKQELYDLSARAGANLDDARIDVDGGFGTAFVYASLGRKELPAGRVIVEGDEVALGKDGTFAGQHVLTSRHGVAVQINAYNFPVWGMLEKLAPALLAGVPSLVKPATPTAYIAEHAVRILLEADILPDGALQLVCGSVPRLLDLLGGQDLVGFTGSAGTAAELRGTPAVTARSLRFTAEADSLNCSVLGPDAVPGTAEFDLYIDGLVTEMTSKAGQKCTAIRRAFVPRRQIEAVTQAARERLSDIVVGAPGADGVRMGPLVGLAQRDEVRSQVGRLRDHARLVFGDPEKVDVAGADPVQGAFLSPLLLRADDAYGAGPHQIEAFGPVSTLLPYESTAELVGLVTLGEGSLVGSVVTHDPQFACDLVLGIAPWHGRVLVLNRDDYRESTGHGIPMPQLVHGGPGRAGGGEEEGGLRAVWHHMQRTAVQGGPAMLAAIEKYTTN